ncbi:SPOR domain-containing protein [Streptomyces odontomachi]|uniref:SPOR domain-containing protein n=1 Tax=Streptomyces odontomachi TaxID=2944940 RepID=UPI00210871E1|nr:SPOR domain-containing protein [Streptomyces sp. ODS25]
MSESATQLVWLVIRKDDNGNRYRIGSYATKAEAEREAEKMANRLDGHGARKLYLVERLESSSTP